jgi:hypothetical protein
VDSLPDAGSIMLAILSGMRIAASGCSRMEE